jgi:hypothetical protein
VIRGIGSALEGAAAPDNRDPFENADDPKAGGPPPAVRPAVEPAAPPAAGGAAGDPFGDDPAEAAPPVAAPVAGDDPFAE